MSSIRDVTDSNFQIALTGSDHPVLVEFGSASCDESHQLKPLVNRIASQYAGRITVIRADFDHSKQMAALYEVEKVPTLLFFHEGEVVQRFEGNVSKHEITEVIDRHLI